MATKEKKSSGFLIVGLAMVLAIGLIGLAAWKPIKNVLDKRDIAATPLEDIGAAASVCDEVTTKPADGSGDHLTDGTEITYPDAPPAFGKHYNEWETLERQFYSTKDRPAIGRLVHNQEHGFTIVWYDESIADDNAAMDDLRKLAAKFEDTEDFRNKLKVAPWLESDGAAFPDGNHVAFTHWSVGGVNLDKTGEQVGVWQYCAEPSGAALADFMKKYPYMDSPEPGVGDQGSAPTGP